MTWQFIPGSNPPRCPAGCVIPKPTDQELRDIFDAIDPELLGSVKYMGLRESVDSRQVIIYENFRSELSAQFLDVLLTDNAPEQQPLANVIRSIFIHELSEPSDPVDFDSENITNIKTEFRGIQWFGGTDRVLIDGQ